MDRRSEDKARRTAKAVAASDDALCTLLSAGLRVQAGEDRWRVIGNTLSYRLLLREAGGTWNRLDQCWEFSGESMLPALKRLTLHKGVLGCRALVYACVYTWPGETVLWGRMRSERFPPRWTVQEVCAPARWTVRLSVASSLCT